MARKHRIKQSEFPYHVTTKVANGEFRFKSKKLQKKFAKIYAVTFLKAMKKYGVQVHHVMVMDNHHHLYLTTPHANIDQFMQYVNARIAEQMNRLLDRSGPFWNGRYHATIVTTKEDQERVIKYIYQNPVRAGIVETPLEFERSSIFFYAFGRPAYVWVTPDQVCVSLGETKKERQRRFIDEFLKIKLTSTELEEIKASLKSQILGNEEVKKRLLEISEAALKVKRKVRK